VPAQADRWKNRRRMAWLSLLSGLAYPVLILATDNPQLGAVAGPFYIFIGAVVGAYIGFATQEDINADKLAKGVEAQVAIDRDARSGDARVGGQRLAAQRQDQSNQPESRHGFDEGF
jgi:hypothetical protein